MQKRKSFTAQSRRPWTNTSTGLFIGMSALMLTACGTLIPPSAARSPLPPSLTSPCPNLTPLADGTGASVLRKLVEVSEQYYACARKHRGLVEAVKSK